MTLPQPCRSCGKPGKALCDPCKALRESARPSRQDRGYDTEYDRNRQAMIDEAWRYQMPCVICGKPFNSKKEITAEHVIPLRQGRVNNRENIRPAHGKCNMGWAKGLRKLR